MSSTPQVVFLTGASSGIGAATARELAERGHRVIATMRRPDAAGDAVRKGYEALIDVVRCDVSDRASVNAAVNAALQQHGRIDVLVNNAGGMVLGAVEDLSEEELRGMFDTNLTGTLRTIQAVLPAMRRQDGGKILNVSSVAGRVTLPAMGGYCASKYALEALSEALRYEVSRWGVQVALVEPGTFKTSAQFENVRVAKALQEGRSLYQEPSMAMMKAHQKITADRPGPRTVAANIADLVELQLPLPLRIPIGDEAIRTFAMRAALTDDEWELALRAIRDEGMPGSYFLAEEQLLQAR